MRKQRRRTTLQSGRRYFVSPLGDTFLFIHVLVKIFYGNTFILGRFTL